MADSQEAQVCPSCRTAGRPDSVECAKCGFPFRRLCRCGGTYSILEGVCPACGVRHRRRVLAPGWSPGRAPLRALGTAGAAVGRAALAPLRALAPARAAGERGRCPSCRIRLESRADECPRCGACLAGFCRCGAPVNRAADRRCAQCGYRVHRRRRMDGRLLLAGTGVAALLLLSGAGFFLFFPRDPFSRRAGWYRQGLSALEGERFQAAADWFSRILAEEPGNTSALFMRGECLYRAGREAKGLADIRGALARDPGMDEALVFLGQVAADRGRPDEALDYLRRAVKSGAEPPAAWLAIGRLELARGRVGASIEAFRSAVRLGAPTDAALTLARLLDERGRILGRPEDLQEARRIWSRVAAKAVERTEPDAAADIRAARACIGLGHYKEALFRAKEAERTTSGAERADALLLMARAFAGQTGPDEDLAGEAVERALAADPSAARYVAAAKFWGELSRGQKEQEVLDRAGKQFPRDLDVLVQCAECAASSGHSDVALAVLGGADESLKARAGYWLELARVFDLAGEGAKAAATLKAARARFPEDRTVLSRSVSARLDALRGRPDDPAFGELTAEVERIYGEDPSSPLAALLLGKLRLYRGHCVEAIDCLKSAVEGDPEDLEAAVLVGVAYLASGNYEEARVRLERALARTSAELPRARLLLAESCYRLELLDRAEAIATRVLERSPRETDARKLLGRIFIARGDLDKAEAEFEALEKVAGESLESSLYLGYLSLREGRADAAEAAFRRSRELAKTPDEQMTVARVQAECYRETNSADRGVGVYENLVRSGRAGVEARVRLADFLLSLGRGDEALAEYRHCLTADASNVEVRRRICEFYFGKKEGREQVDRQIEGIRRIHPDDLSLNYLEGKRDLIWGDAAAAVTRLSEYVEKAPDDADGQYALGLARLETGDPVAAVSRLRAALARVPGSLPIREALGEALSARAAEIFRTGDYAAAAELVRKSLRYSPERAGADLLLADALARLGDVAESETYCRKVVAREPENVDALRLLASICTRNHDLSGAADALARAVAIAKDPGYDQYRLARVHLAMKDYARALDLARKAAAGVGAPAFAADVVTAALIGSGDAAAAEKYVRGLLQETPGSAIAQSLMGVVQRARHDQDGAVRSFAAALKLDPKLRWALWQILAVYLDDRGDRPGALVEVTSRLGANPDDPDLNYIAAWLYAGEMRPERARPYLDRALKADPGHRSSVLLLAKIGAETGHPEEGRDGLCRLLGQDPHDAEVLFVLASSFDRAGETELAIRRYRDVLAVKPDHAGAMNNLAMCLLHRPGGIEEARSLAERAVAASPENPAYLDTLGRVLLKSGKSALAEQTLKDAVKRYEQRRARLDRLLTAPRARAWRERTKAAKGEVEARIRETLAAIRDATD